MTGNTYFNLELKNILLAIIRDYGLSSQFVGWETVHDLPHPPHQLIDILLTEGRLLIVVTDTVEDETARIEGLRECYNLIAALYDYLVQALYPNFADQALDFSFYETDTFLVLVFTGPVPMVIEAIGRQVLPWVYHYYQYPPPNEIIMNNLAVAVLKVALGEIHDSDLRQGIIERILPLRLTYLQPLDLMAFVEPTDAPLSGQSDDSAQVQDNGSGPQEPEETQPFEPPQPTNRAQNGHKPNTAPLPGYFGDPAET